MTVMVFKSPGPHKIHGYQVEYRVIDEQQAGEHLADGWHMTAIGAGEALQKQKDAEKLAAEEAADDSRAVQRFELVQKATELGIRVDKRMGDKRLVELIEAKLAEPSSDTGADQKPS